MGFGYIFVLLTMGVFRELLGTGKLVFFGKQLISFGPGFDPPRILILFPGAFLTFGFYIALVRFLKRGGT